MYLYKAYFKELMIEYGFNKNNNKTIILLPGLPYYPRPDKYMKELVLQGYNSIYIRYPGTYESKGKFLKENPAIIINELISYLKENGEFVELYANLKQKINSSKIIVIANSFGGAIAFSILKNNKHIDNLIALSPVINFSEFHKLKSKTKEAKKLKLFLKKGFQNTFRFNEKDYDEMVEGSKIISVDTKQINIKTNIIIAKDDTVVPVSHIDSFEFSNKVNIEYLEKGGHLSIDYLNIDKIKKLTK